MNKELILLVFLLMNTLSDLKKRKIVLWSLPIFLLLSFWWNSMNLVSIVSAMLPGLFFLFISCLSRGAIGFGDGLVLLVLGLYSGFIECFALTVLALLLAGLWGGIALFRGRCGRHSSIPWMPFLLIAYLGRTVFL